jgi:hypothetical protein
MAGDRGYRTILGVPLLRRGAAIGVIILTRSIMQPFTPQQIELVTTFADQAVIAIENVRLFDEVQARTEELRRSLQQQTATAGVLEVISRSAFDLKSVFETVAESAVRLCEADRAFIYRFDGELLRMAVALNAPEALKNFLKQNRWHPDDRTAQHEPRSNAVQFISQMPKLTPNIHFWTQLGLDWQCRC